MRNLQVFSTFIVIESFASYPHCIESRRNISVASLISGQCSYFIPLKTLEKPCVSVAVRGYKMGTLAKNGLNKYEIL